MTKTTNHLNMLDKQHEKTAIREMIKEIDKGIDETEEPQKNEYDLEKM